MSRIYSSIDSLIGQTPLVRLHRLEQRHNVHAALIAKLECFNPAGSVKDRVALQMILDAEEKGLLKKGSTIIEPTSGNTGIGLCAVAAIKGYSVIIVMPDTMSVERRQIMQAYGAKVVLTDGKRGMTGAIAKAEELAAEIENSFIPSQFDNPANPIAHYQTTGPEIVADCDGKIDFFVCGVGTGGTITGVGRYLKEHCPGVKIIAVEPTDSSVLSGKPAGPHGIQGIGAGFIPSILDTKIYDEIIPVKTEDAYQTGASMGKLEGIPVGISGGAALYAALDVAKRAENKNKNIVVLLADGGERYLSTPMYQFT